MLDRKLTQTLFLDRDGVINVERPNDYAKNINEFVFVEGALQAIKKLSEIFQYIFIVTNQRGVGRGIMSKKDLDVIHNYMVERIKEHGGNITKIYSCIDVDSTSINRKPNTGMAFMAQRDYPNVDFGRSVMVGNSKSDVEFGNKLGIYTVLVGNKYSEQSDIYNNISAYYPDLCQFALSL